MKRKKVEKNIWIIKNIDRDKVREKMFEGLKHNFVDNFYENLLIMRIKNELCFRK